MKYFEMFLHLVIYSSDSAPLSSGYMNTAVCTSRITFIDGEKGILRYRGYPIEQLASKSSFMETAFLLLYGELPSEAQLKHFCARVYHHQTALHADIVALLQTIRHDAHCMTSVISALAAMSALHPEANPALEGQGVYSSRKTRESQMFTLLGAFPTLAAHVLLRRSGSSVPCLPAPSLATLLDPARPRAYVEHFLVLLGLGKARPGEEGPDPRVVRALDAILLAHADHELNCSTAAVRHLTSSGVDVYTAVAGATGALYGPLHGGATEAVLRMLQQIGTEERIPAFLEAVKAKEAKLMGFGHRVYKNYDPRAVLVREVAYEVFQVYGADPLIHVATALETAARSDDYFVSRKLYPNIDFYSGLVYKAIGFPLDFFPVLFTMGRMAGWLAHWEELLMGPEEEKKIVRPRQIYLGPAERAFLPIEARGHVRIAAEPERLLPSTTRARL